MKKFPFLHLILFVLTLLSTITVGAMQRGINVFEEPAKIYTGLPFAVTLVTILLSHELSHYFASKKHKVKATLPYFIPAPTIIGTFGAFIKMKSPIISRKSLIDIGASGPIAGFVVSVIASVIGLNLSDVVSVAENKGALGLGDSLLFSFLSRLIIGIPPENHDILLNPIAFAGWIGLFVTSINLLPIGQLDGGHITYALIGDSHAFVSKLLIIVLLLLGVLLWEGWLIWGILLVFLGVRHPPVIYWEMSLDRRRKSIGFLALLILLITFIPVPFKIL